MNYHRNLRRLPLIKQLKDMKEEFITVSHGTLPPTVLIIRDEFYTLEFGNNTIPFSKHEAAKIVKALLSDLI